MLFCKIRRENIFAIHQSVFSSRYIIRGIKRKSKSLEKLDFVNNSWKNFVLRTNLLSLVPSVTLTMLIKGPTILLIC